MGRYTNLSYFTFTRCSLHTMSDISREFVYHPPNHPYIWLDVFLSLVNMSPEQIMYSRLVTDNVGYGTWGREDEMLYGEGKFSVFFLKVEVLLVHRTVSP